METEGNLDLWLGLYGPDDEGVGLREDDDSGRRLNARIITDLLPGIYTLKVRHYSGRRTVTIRSVFIAAIVGGHRDCCCRIPTALPGGTAP
ncbi:MAG: hypothetical protein R2867_00835 [Caldilineaceae bacterium]